MPHEVDERIVLPLQRALVNEAPRVGADRVVCFQSTRLTPFAHRETELFVLAGYHKIPVPAVLTFLQSCRFIDWLLHEGPGHLPRRRDDEPLPDEFGDRLLHYLKSEYYFTVIRGPVTEPWLVVVYLFDAPLRDDQAQRCQESATRLAHALFISWCNPVDTRRRADIAQLAERHIAALDAIRLEREGSFEQYLRNLLANVVTVVRPEGHIGVIGNVHMFTRKLFAEAETLRAEGDIGPNCLQDDRGPWQLIDHLVEMPIHDRVAADRVRRSGDVVLHGVCEFGGWEAKAWRDRRNFPIDAFEPGKLTTTPNTQCCLMMHAAVLGESYFIPQATYEGIGWATRYIPHFGDHRCFFSDDAFSRNFENSSNLIIPLIDIEAGVCLGVVNIEGPAPPEGFGPANVTLAQCIAQRAASAMREAREHGVGRFVQQEMNAALASGLNTAFVEHALEQMCDKLAGLYGAHVELYDGSTVVGPNGAIPAELARSHQERRSDLRAPPPLSLLRACASKRSTLIFEAPGTVLQIRLKRSDEKPDYSEVLNADNEEIDPEIMLEERGDLIPEDDRQHDTQARTSHGGTSTLLVPLRLPYPRNGATEDYADFCAGVVVLHRYRSWRDVVNHPASLHALGNLTKLFVLIERARAQMPDVTRIANPHDYEPEHVSSLQDVLNCLYEDGDLPGHTVEYLRLGLVYLQAMFQTYAAPEYICRKAITLQLKEGELENLIRAVRGLVDAYDFRELDLYAALTQVDYRLFPLLLGVRNLYANARSQDLLPGGDAATDICIDLNNPKCIVITNEMDTAAFERFRLEKEIHPRGRPGKGRGIVNMLAAKFYRNVYVQESDPSIIAADRYRFEVNIGIGQAPM